MNAFTVVLILFIAALVAAVLLAVFVKKSRRTWIAAAAALVPAAFISVLVVSVTFASLPTGSASAGYSVSTASENGYLDMAFALISQGETVGAEKILDEFASEYPSSDRYMLARARMEAMRKNYTQADGIYRYLEEHSSLNKEDISPEHNEVILLAKGGGTYSKLAELIIKSIGDMSLPEEALKAAEVYSRVDAMGENTDDSINAATAVKDYKSYIESHPYLFASSTMELSYLKALVLAGDYETIVVRSPNYNDSHSMLILAELCRTNKISNTILSKSDVNGVIHEKNERIYNWIEGQEKSNDYSEDQEVIDSAKEMLDQTDISTPKRYKQWVRSQLLALAENPDEKDASKLYLELARLDFDDDSSTDNSELIQKALMTAGNCEDTVYASSAAAINEILKDKNNTEGLKNIDRYVEEMVENMTAQEMKENFGSDLTAEDRSFVRSISSNLGVEASSTSEYATDEPAPDYDNGGINFGAMSTPVEEPQIILVDSEYDSEYEDTDSDQAEKKAFSSYVTTQVNQITASINIASVDASKFDEVSMVVAVDKGIVDSEEKFKNNVELYDCGIRIKDYKVEKVEDEKFNVLLVCDNSGSMMGDKISNLKSSLDVFVNNLTDDVRVGIVAFDDSILSGSCAPLGSDKAKLKAAISSMDDRGGTNILIGVNEAIGMAKPGDGYNVMIVMSDGQDSMPGTDTLNEISKKCRQNDIVIYSMGLGSDVDAEVLSAYSSIGGGNYTYVSDSNALLSFYQYLYNISRNRFRVTFKAQDTLLVNRNASVVYTPDSKISSSYPYTIETETPDPDDPDGTDDTEDEDDELTDETDIPLKDISISGFDTRLIYRSSSEQEILLLGEGFTKDTELTVTLQGGMTYELKCEYVDETSFKVIIPANIACGEYDVIVNVNGRRCIFENGLTVSSNKSNTVRFGDYVFKASNVARMTNETILTGYVTMNNWLGFVGGVTITGNAVTDNSVRITASYAYVSYNNGDEDLNPQAAAMAGAGNMILIPDIDVTLYRNSDIAVGSSEFMSDQFGIRDGIVIQNLMRVPECSCRLFPDRLEASFTNVSTLLPMQERLMSFRNLHRGESAFDFRFSDQQTLKISGTAVECKLDWKPSSVERNNFDDMYFGNLKMASQNTAMSLSVDTTKAQADISLPVNLEMINDGLVLGFTWKGSALDSISMKTEYDAVPTVCGVPVIFSSFELSAKDLKGKALSDIQLTGSCKFAASKLSSATPKMDWYAGDVAMFSADNLKMTFCPANRYIEMNGSLKLLGSTDLGQTKMRLGSALAYSNGLMGKEHTLVNGIVGSFEKGWKYSQNGSSIETGSGGTFVMSSDLFGIYTEGKVKYNVKWWKQISGDDADARMFMGYCRTGSRDDDYSFVMTVSNGSKTTTIEWDPKAVMTS